MAIRIPTSDQSKIFLGSQEIGAVYVGANKVWPDAPLIDPNAMILRIVIPTNNYTLTIPFFPTTGYNGQIDWRDGSKSTITAYNDADRVHVYNLAGTYDIELTGVFKGLYFNNRGNKLQLTKIVQWGNVGMNSLVRAFDGCTNLEIDDFSSIPSTITSIGNYAFRNCTSLSGQLILHSGITSIGNYAFQNCTSLSGQLILHSGITSIGDYAFSKCTSLSGQLNIPPLLTKISAACFEYCSGLSGQLTIPTNVTVIDYWAFRYCTGLIGQLFLHNGITTIGERAFSHAGFSGSVTIPSSMTSTNRWILEYTNVSEIIISSPISLLTFGMFQNSPNLTYVFIPSSVSQINDGAFGFCNNPSLVVWVENPIPCSAAATFLYNISPTAKIKVPAASVAAYKAAAGWSSYASRIFAQ